MPNGVQVVDGPEEGRKAVREEIMYGADWIKVYSDHGYFVSKDANGRDILDDIPTFTVEEMRAIVDEAHRQHHKVASHAVALNGVHTSLEAGVDTIEHGDYISDEDLKTMAARGVYYVPTIYVGVYVAQGRANEGAPVWLQMTKIHEDTFRRAMKAGVKITFGTGAFVHCPRSTTSFACGARRRNVARFASICGETSSGVCAMAATESARLRRSAVSMA